MLGFDVALRVRNVPLETLIDDLQRVSKASGRKAMVTARTYAQEGRFGVTTILRRFGSWNEGLAAAGLPINCVSHNSDALLMANLARVWRALGRQPIGTDIDKARGISVFSLGTYEKRYGSWNKALQAFAAHFGGEDSPEANLPPSRSILRPRRRSPRRVNWRLRAEVLIRAACAAQARSRTRV
jgi:hypothetical protein